MRNKISKAAVRPVIVLKELRCRKAEGPLPRTPAVPSSANTTCCSSYRIPELAGFGHKEIDQLWVGKHSGPYPVLTGRKVLSYMGSSAKVEDGGGWPGNAS